MGENKENLLKIYQERKSLMERNSALSILFVMTALPLIPSAPFQACLFITAVSLFSVLADWKFRRGAETGFLKPGILSTA